MKPDFLSSSEEESPNASFAFRKRETEEKMYVDTPEHNVEHVHNVEHMHKGPTPSPGGNSIIENKRTQPQPSGTPTYSSGTPISEIMDFTDSEEETAETKEILNMYQGNSSTANNKSITNNKSTTNNKSIASNKNNPPIHSSETVNNLAFTDQGVSDPITMLNRSLQPHEEEENLEEAMARNMRERTIPVPHVNTAAANFWGDDSDDEEFPLGESKTIDQSVTTSVLNIRTIPQQIKDTRENNVIPFPENNTSSLLNMDELSNGSDLFNEEPQGEKETRDIKNNQRDAENNQRDTEASGTNQEIQVKATPPAVPPRTNLPKKEIPTENRIPTGLPMRPGSCVPGTIMGRPIPQINKEILKKDIEEAQVTQPKKISADPEMSKSPVIGKTTSMITKSSMLPKSPMITRSQGMPTMKVRLPSPRMPIKEELQENSNTPISSNAPEKYNVDSNTPSYTKSPVHTNVPSDKEDSKEERSNLSKQIKAELPPSPLLNNKRSTNISGNISNISNISNITSRSIRPPSTSDDYNTFEIPQETLRKINGDFNRDSTRDSNRDSNASRDSVFTSGRSNSSAYTTITYREIKDDMNQTIKEVKRKLRKSMKKDMKKMFKTITEMETNKKELERVREEERERIGDKAVEGLEKYESDGEKLRQILKNLNLPSEIIEKYAPESSSKKSDININNGANNGTNINNANNINNAKTSPEVIKTTDSLEKIMENQPQEKKRTKHFEPRINIPQKPQKTVYAESTTSINPPAQMTGNTSPVITNPGLMETMNELKEEEKQRSKSQETIICLDVGRDTAQSSSVQSSAGSPLITQKSKMTVPPPKIPTGEPKNTTMNKMGSHSKLGSMGSMSRLNSPMVNANQHMPSSPSPAMGARPMGGIVGRRPPVTRPNLQVSDTPVAKPHQERQPSTFELNLDGPAPVPSSSSIIMDYEEDDKGVNLYEAMQNEPEKPKKGEEEWIYPPTSVAAAVGMRTMQACSWLGSKLFGTKPTAPPVAQAPLVTKREKKLPVPPTREPIKDTRRYTTDPLPPGFITREKANNSTKGPQKPERGNSEEQGL